MTAEDTIVYLKDLLLYYMDELEDIHNTKDAQFAYGEKTAYVECLEILQKWDESMKNGLDFNIEKKYPL